MYGRPRGRGAPQDLLAAARAPPPRDRASISVSCGLNNLPLPHDIQTDVASFVEVGRLQLVPSARNYLPPIEVSHLATRGPEISVELVPCLHGGTEQSGSVHPPRQKYTFYYIIAPSLSLSHPLSRSHFLPASSSLLR